MKLKSVKQCGWDRFKRGETAIRPRKSSKYETENTQFLYPVILEHIKSVEYYPYGCGFWNGRIPNNDPTVVFHLNQRSLFSSDLLIDGLEGMVYPWPFVDRSQARLIYTELNGIIKTKGI